MRRAAPSARPATYSRTCSPLLALFRKLLGDAEYDPGLATRVPARWVRMQYRMRHRLLGRRDALDVVVVALVGEHGAAEANTLAGEVLVDRSNRSRAGGGGSRKIGGKTAACSGGNGASN